MSCLKAKSVQALPVLAKETKSVYAHAVVAYLITKEIKYHHTFMVCQFLQGRAGF